MKLDRKTQLLQKRRWRIRKKVRGTAERPRLSVRFTNLNVHAQIIDDVEGKTLASASSMNKDLRDQKLLPNVAGAAAMGKILGERAKAAGVEKVVLDRSGRRYHGCVKAFADAAREAGLSF